MEPNATMSYAIMLVQDEDDGSAALFLDFNVQSEDPQSISFGVGLAQARKLRDDIADAVKKMEGCYQ